MVVLADMADIAGGREELSSLVCPPGGGTSQWLKGGKSAGGISAGRGEDEEFANQKGGCHAAAAAVHPWRSGKEEEGRMR